MKKINYTYILFAIFISIITGCNIQSSSSKESSENKPSNKRDKEVLTSENINCYLEVTPYHTEFNGEKIQLADSLYISVNIKEQNINGIYNWLPAEKDQLRGSYEGEIINDTANVIYTYYGEGQKNTDQLMFIVSKKSIYILEGERKMVEDIFRYTKGTKLYVSDTIRQITCN